MGRKFYCVDGENMLGGVTEMMEKDVGQVMKRNVVCVGDFGYVEPLELELLTPGEFDSLKCAVWGGFDHYVLANVLQGEKSTHEMGEALKSGLEKLEKFFVVKNKWVFPKKYGCPNCGNLPGELEQPCEGAGILCPRCGVTFASDVRYEVTHVEID